DLHDSTIQSLFAIALNLERCQRLASSNPHELGTQLGTAVAGLKTVIRDLRGYILGVEPTIANGQSLESALHSLVSDINSSNRLNVRLDVASAAADRLTPEQAAQILAIAREA